MIHRDLKPADVMITGEEKVKILDFGLAKALSDDTQSIDSSKSPTLTEAMTQPGVILGTAAYMSPEQAKGKSVDKRADIWAFGCILYECLTGKKAFRGETVTETLAAIIRGEPDWDALPSTLSLNIRKLIRRCMYKDQKKRLPHIGNVRIEIDESDIEAFSVPVMPKIQVWRERVAWIAIAFLATLAMFLGYRITQQAGPAVTSPAVRFELPLPDQLFGLEASELSPDGRSIAYRKRSENLYQLAVINLTTLDVTTISDSGGLQIFSGSQTAGQLDSAAEMEV